MKQYCTESPILEEWFASCSAIVGSKLAVAFRKIFIDEYDGQTFRFGMS